MESEPKNAAPEYEIFYVKKCQLQRSCTSHEVSRNCSQTTMPRGKHLPDETQSNYQGTHLVRIMVEASKKGTLGEELFNVHLSRMSPDIAEDDVDNEFKQTHTPQTTLGDSLWQAHLKRSAGLEEEADGVETMKHSTGKRSRLQRLNQGFVPEASSSGLEATSRRSAPSRTLNLRNRQVIIS